MKKNSIYLFLMLMFCMGSNGSVVAQTTPGWQYNITGASHSILIQNTSPVTIDMVQLSNGDYIGVFTKDQSGAAVCGGYIEYQGSSTVIIAWEDDGTTPQKDGFVSGDTIFWKLWRAADGATFDATPTYLPNVGTITNQGIFESGGMSGLLSLSSNVIPQTQSQLIPLLLGWNLISSYIEPDTPNLESVFDSIASHIYIVKNGLGVVYWPAFNLNMIGNWNNLHGYQVKTNTTDTLVMVGTQLMPESTPMPLPSGWSMIAYLRSNPGNVELMTSNISTNTILIKNYLGQVYWLAFNLNMLGDMLPGQGYKIKMLNADTLVYPAN